MKKYITTSEAAIIAETLRKIVLASEKSPAIAAALDINRYEIAKCDSVLKRIGK